jgi:hypothetical protein
LNGFRVRVRRPQTDKACLKKYKHDYALVTVDDNVVLWLRFDKSVKSQIWDGFVKTLRSRLANPENTAIAGAAGSVLSVRRSDEG